MEAYYNKLTAQHALKMLKAIKSKVYTPVSQLEMQYFVEKEPVKFSEIQNYEFRKIEIGAKWGDLWDCGWFRFSGEVPSGYFADELVLIIDISGEACIFDEAGTPLRGLSNKGYDVLLTDAESSKRIVPLAEVWESGRLDILVEAGCNDLFGNDTGGILKQACFAHLRNDLRKLYYDFSFLYMLAETLDKDEEHYWWIIKALEKACFALSSEFKPEEVKAAGEFLAPELKRRNAENLLQFYAVGHAHMDLAWLWPIRETKRKIGRTFATVLANMKNYPDYIFGASQPQQWQWLKEDYPGLYTKFIQKVKEQRIEPQGAMWVEADTNVSGGESLVRQIMYGMKFFSEECGVKPSLVWLPDVFGFSANLPQIMQKSGVDNFVTIKLSWSRFNQFPHTTFWWEGLDGSRVLAHMPPELDYNSSAAPKSLKKARRNFVEKGIVDKALLLYGMGDGGGGPSRYHLERLARSKNILGLPQIKNAGSEQFFRDLRKNLPELKTYKGEMYLEVHQGTYTTQSKNKKFNRLMEKALRNAELLCVINFLKTGAGYPADKLEKIWKEVLLYQFHDILPGSSIARVYNESVERYQCLLEETEAVISVALESLCGAEGVSAFSSVPFAVADYARYNGQWYYVKSAGAGITGDVSLCNSFTVSAENGHIENKLLRAEFNADGTIKSLYDKVEKRETVLEGNKLAVYNDFGDAWDMNENYRESLNGAFKLLNSETYADGAEAVHKMVFGFNNSTLTQYAVLREDSLYLEFRNEIDWQENAKMLRAEFVFDVQTDEVACDIQFGSVRRRTTKNNSIEWAQFEICAHKWVDLSDKNYGIALLNDCKYGHNAERNRISLNLLRSTNYPGINADRGKHTFAYALYPHAGDSYNGGVNKAAYLFNNPVRIFKGSGSLCPFCTDNENIIIETVKTAEDRSGDIVIRMYESSGVDSTAGLILDEQIKFDFYYETDMTEKPAAKKKLTDSKINLKFTPFEIKTLRLGMKRPNKEND